MVGLCLCFGMHALPQCQRCYGCAAMPCPVFKAAAGVSGLAVAACLERGYCLVVDAGDVDLAELTFVSLDVVLQCVEKPDDVFGRHHHSCTYVSFGHSGEDGGEVDGELGA